VSRLRGSKELQARLKAIGQAFKPIGRKWADDTSEAARPKVPVTTGRLRGSFRRRNATAKRATVVGHYTAYFIDAGTKPHVITPKRARGLVFEGRSGTVFARKVHHRGTRAQPFRAKAAREGLRETDMAAQLTKLWNEAA
jgi:hypothetical protein